MTGTSASPDFSFLRHLNDGPLGRMEDASNRKLLFNLISTLNCAFPDYDFSTVKPNHFTKHRMADAVTHVHNTLFQIGGPDYAQSTSLQLWKALDEVRISGKAGDFRSLGRRQRRLFRRLNRT
jgi:hypothetical protein